MALANKRFIICFVALFASAAAARSKIQLGLEVQVQELLEENTALKQQLQAAGLKEDLMKAKLSELAGLFSQTDAKVQDIIEDTTASRAAAEVKEEVEDKLGVAAVKTKVDTMLTPGYYLAGAAIGQIPAGSFVQLTNDMGGGEWLCMYGGAPGTVFSSWGMPKTRSIPDDADLQPSPEDAKKFFDSEKGHFVGHGMQGAPRRPGMLKRT